MSKIFLCFLIFGSVTFKSLDMFCIKIYGHIGKYMVFSYTPVFENNTISYLVIAVLFKLLIYVIK